MKSSSSFKNSITSFPKNFWVVIVMEFFERGSYYGVMSVLSIYLVLRPSEGGLGFSKESVGLIKSVIQPLLYILPILSGAIAEQYGYRKTLFFSFTVMSLGYFLTSMATSYNLVFLSLICMALGAGFFKPIIAGTIARNTDESNSALGFGIYYWSINLGAFLFPLILIPYLKQFSWSYIFLMAAVGTGWLLFLNFFVYKDPRTEISNSENALQKVFANAILVLKDYRFLLMIVIYSGFWILYFQMFDSVLWYLKEHIDMAPVNSSINWVLSFFISNPNWKFDAEHVTVINALTIIVLQIAVSNFVKNKAAITTMISGILMGTLGIGMLAISSNAWVFIAGMIIFSVGEMTAHPKFISYVGLIAPPDKKAIYQGYAFLYGVLGSGIGGILGAKMYVLFVEKLNMPSVFWLIFVIIGLATAIGLLLFNIYLTPKREN